jgi:hypothetical protein
MSILAGTMDGEPPELRATVKFQVANSLSQFSVVNTQVKQLASKHPIIYIYIKKQTTYHCTFRRVELHRWDTLCNKTKSQHHKGILTPQSEISNSKSNKQLRLVPGAQDWQTSGDVHSRQDDAQAFQHKAR